MNKQKIISYLQSIVAIPMLAVALPLTGIQSIPDMASVINNKVEVSDSAITTQEKEDLKIATERAKQVDAFFKKYDAPLAGYGMKFVTEAKKNDIDWRLLPAIAMRETTGGKQACKNPKAPNNNFGWASCKSGFESVDKSIEHISKTLSGNNANAIHYTDGMTTDKILKKYNPDSIIPGYSKQVIKIMKMINDNEEIV
ncbi:MAG: hypothetical protein NTV03_01335 [Candidatus Nomurabacteria bacterium]|nr:hypothetical protein [Candidatus Nomurabacteria bacterium]